jgi:hypothetical protein
MSRGPAPVWTDAARSVLPGVTTGLDPRLSGSSHARSEGLARDVALLLRQGKFDCRAIGDMIENLPGAPSRTNACA